jgi:hypothetical protein
MKIIRKTLALIFLSSMLTISGCSKSNNADKALIPSPSKIIAYNNGQTKTLTSEDKEYKDIVELTNRRVVKKNLSTAKDGIEIDNFVKDEKKNATAVEFLHDEEAKIDVKNSNGFDPIKFYKLFFKLNEDSSKTNTVFQYGDKDKYIDSSRGPLKESKELLELVNNIFK